MENLTETIENQDKINPVQELCFGIKAELQKVIIGQNETIDMLLAALLTGGHVLLEGVPGIAKTLMAKMLARTIQSSFSRIQFTPDLMPSDILGASVFNMKTSEFSFNPGPIFANVILIDEINRAPAKTQSALFQVMEEGQVSIDGLHFDMGDPFFVMATQNPIEQEGTYRLPEAQLDRFLFRLKLSYPSLEEEQLILRLFQTDFRQRQISSVQEVLTPETLLACKTIVEQVHIEANLLDYIAEIVYSTRKTGDLFLGASPRASLAIMKSSKALAAMNGRNFVSPDDIRTVSLPVLNHRVVLQPEREMEGKQTETVLAAIIESIATPR